MRLELWDDWRELPAARSGRQEPLYVESVADDREWPPLSEEQVQALGDASLAEAGWLRLNKPPLDHLLKYFSARSDGHRDLSALLTLLAYAVCSVKEKTNPVEGTVAGSDSYLASLAGMDRKTFSRAADSLCAGWFVTRLDPKTPRGCTTDRSGGSFPNDSVVTHDRSPGHQ